MNDKKEKQTTSLQMVEVDHNMFAIEIIDGNISANLTQMAKPFGKSKQPSDWLKTSQSKEFIEFLTVPTKIGTADLVKVIQGGKSGMQGTWAYDYQIVLEFARWLSPEFSVKVNKLVWKLLTGQAKVLEPINGVWPISYEGKVGYPRKQVCISVGYSYTSGTMGQIKKKFPDENFQICGVACWSARFTLLRIEQGKVRQLELDFYRDIKAGV